jgi:TRAP-type C4-dicarboxylate transport system permease large subunit
MLAMCIEIGVIHPPAGMNLFAVSGVTGIPVGRIALQSIPFIVVLLLVLCLVAFAPLPIFSWS